MVIPTITAITLGSRIAATSRVRAVSRGTGAAEAASEVDEAEEIVLVRRRKPGRSSRNAIMASGSAATRSSAAVQDQLTKLKLGG